MTVALVLAGNLGEDDAGQQQQMLCGQLAALGVRRVDAAERTGPGLLTVAAAARAAGDRVLICAGAQTVPGSVLARLLGAGGTAAVIHLCWMSAPEALVGATFIGLGSLAGLALPEVWIKAGVIPGTLMLAGGLIYIAGALSYHQRRPDPSPAVFGFHEVFHACVCAAATCQYAAIALVTARTGG